MKLRLFASLALCSVCSLASACKGERANPWSLGESYEYRVHLSTDAKTDQAAAASLFDFDLRGTLALTPLELGAEHRRFSVALKDVVFASSQAVETRARFDKVAHELEQVQLISFDEGRLHDQQLLPRDAEALTVAIVRNLAIALQAPSAPPKSATSIEAFDATGRYVAEFTPTERPDALRMRKVRYLELTTKQLLSAQGAQAPMPMLRESSGELVRHGDVVESSHYHELSELELIAGRTLAVRTDLELALQKHAKTAPVDLTDLKSHGLVLAANEPYNHGSANFDLDAAKIGGRSFDEVISELEALSRDDKDALVVAARNGKPSAPEDVARGQKWTGASMKLFVALSAIMRRDPTAVQRGAALVRSHSAATPGILSSLGAAGTEASQQALIGLIRQDGLDDDTRRSAAFSLVRAKNPLPSSADALAGWLDDAKWHEYAQLGLGTFVRLFRESGRSDDATKYGNLLVEHLEHAPNDAVRIALLTGISNSAYVGALPSVTKHLSHPNPEVRAAAVQALRLMKAAQVDAMIQERAQDDDRAVRIAALTAMLNREQTDALSRSAVARLEQDQDAVVRQEALRVVSAWSDTHAELQAALERAAQNDDSQAVRTAAQNALARVKAAR